MTKTFNIKIDEFDIMALMGMALSHIEEYEREGKLGDIAHTHRILSNVMLQIQKQGGPSKQMLYTHELRKHGIPADYDRPDMFTN